MDKNNKGKRRGNDEYPTTRPTLGGSLLYVLDRGISEDYGEKLEGSISPLEGTTLSQIMRALRDARFMVGNRLWKTQRRR